MIDAEQLASVLADLRLARFVGIEELRGGSTAVFRVDLADDTALILKTYDRAEMVPHREAYASGLLAAVNVPHPRYLLIDESLTRLPYRFALTTYVTGVVGSAFLAERELFTGIGRLARQLHSVALPGFGALPEPEYETNAAYISGLANHAFGRFLEYGADPVLARSLRAIFERDFASVVLEADRPVFAHDDLHPGNVLVSGVGAGVSIVGLVDFGNARASTALMDLAKTIFICEHEMPGIGAAVLAGYGPIDHPDPEKALAFYTLLHRVIMWWWLRHIGVLATADAEVDVMSALRVTAADG
ncbi:phosphotransferase family protein [Devosia sp.]|uniref:phosphotransferase family protein n=1 Tax=Devosia sp. TaxID=1871048 RepID=UPI001B28C0D3|nr:aminoglycoside phosphotransferase family protein [Devosia sp.]MBO9587188.1 aminoglycoside phosphotransferase family protein [Devosia sp.]